MDIMNSALYLVFLASLATCAYIYFGYPALIYLLAKLRPRPVRKAKHRVPVTLIIPAHNEASILEQKMRNVRALDYPAELLRTIVVSDGSTDATSEVLRSHLGDDVALVELERGGKARALNAGAERATGEILVFTDANSMMEAASLGRIADNFADPEVGGVCGNQVYRMRSASDATQQGENLYWRYDKWQKKLESRFGSIFASDGSLHAVRRDLYVPIEDPAQADDIAISTRVVLQGSRLVFEPDAVTYEDAPSEGGSEFRRKIRVTNRSVRALLLLGIALWTSGFYSVELVSHKLLRHFAPIFLIATLVSSAALANRSGWLALFLAAQVGFYGLAVMGYLLRATRLGRRRLLTVPYFFSLANLAALFGLVSLALGSRLSMWSPRTGDSRP